MKARKDKGGKYKTDEITKIAEKIVSFSSLLCVIILFLLCVVFTSFTV